MAPDSGAFFCLEKNILKKLKKLKKSVDNV
nr:MAG TPA: hypothetical protein [Caudoviricetes sp.]